MARRSPFSSRDRRRLAAIKKERRSKFLEHWRNSRIPRSCLETLHRCYNPIWWPNLQASRRLGSRSHLAKTWLTKLISRRLTSMISSKMSKWRRSECRLNYLSVHYLSNLYTWFTQFTTSCFLTAFTALCIIASWLSEMVPASLWALKLLNFYLILLNTNSIGL